MSARSIINGRTDDDGGDFSDSFPIYRHPADESPPLLPFSPTVERIRKHVEDALHEPVNHVLIQHYRSGADYISEHSDKTIDVVRGSKIVNVSLGAQRVMTLRTKKDALAKPKADLDEPTSPTTSSERPEGEEKKRGVQRVPLPHNSIFVMGMDTNAKWLHTIRTDKRPMKVKSKAERFQSGQRISLTFRTIGTFLSKDEERIFGQGATGKTREEARPVVRGGSEAERLIVAFGRENHQSDFDWEAHYGQGSDVLHFTTRAV